MRYLRLFALLLCGCYASHDLESGAGTMHLISSLASGVAGAENGTVSMVLRGTSTPATYYTDFEGTSSATATNVALDQYGGKVMFVNALVTVTVRNSGGSIVRQFTDGVSAPAVEVRSASFNGAAYSGGAVAPGNPTTLQSVLDKWATSAGTTDFKVDINGTPTNLESAFAAVAGLRYFVVTDPAYGAVGDGVTNDLAAFQAAINAANAAGGGVVFVPRGSFLLNGTLTSYATVALLGADRFTSLLFVASSSASLTTGAQFTSISNLTITANAADYTGSLFSATTTSICYLSNVSITGAISGSIFTATTLASIEARDSTFSTRVTGYVVNQAAASMGASFYDCSLTASSSEAASGTMVVANVVKIFNTTVTILNNGSAGTKTIISAPASVTASGLSVGNIGGTAALTVFSSSSVRETGTYTTAGSGTMTLYAASIGLTTSQLGSRILKTANVSADTDPVVIPSLNNRHVQARVTTTAGWAGNCQVELGRAPRGVDIILSFWNDTAGAVTFEWSTNVSIAAATTFAVAADSFRTFHLVSGDNDPTSTTQEWFLVSDVAGAEVVE